MAGRWNPALVLSVAVLAACVPGPAVVTAPATAVESPVATRYGGLRPGVDFPTQRLYRVRYQGPEGQGSLKLTLRLERPDRFQLHAADPLGRAVWSLELDSEAGLWLDHRRRIYCDLTADVRLPQIVVARLSVSSLPVVMLGRLPFPAAGSVGETDGERRLRYTDTRGRRWSAVINADAVESWTLWDGDRPQLWWSRQAGGGILSAQEGAQFRWRETVSEELSEPLDRLQVPPGYDVGECVAAADPVDEAAAD